MQNANTSPHAHGEELRLPRFDLVSRMATLAEAHDEDALLEALGRLAIPTLADLCVVHVVGDSAPRRAVVAHHDPRQQERAETLLNDDAVRLACANEANSTAISGRNWIRAEVDSSELPSTLRIVLQQLDARSTLVVPLRVSSRTFAVVSFIATTLSGRMYDDDDVARAEQLVAQVGTLIENLRLHELIRARDEKMRLALEKSSVRIFEVDRNLAMTWLTAPMPPSTNEGPELLLAIEEAQRASFRTGEQTTVEGDGGLDEDARHWVVTHTPVLDADRRVMRLIGTAVDVTEERRVQHELSEALKFRDQVLGMIGHDLRNPLSAIFGVIGIAQLGPLPPQAVAHVAQLDRAARRMLEMIGTLLDFSEARFSHALPISLADVDLREVGAAVVSELSSARPDRAIEFVAHGDTRGWWDRSRLAQVASNLLGNALTHGDPHAAVTLSIADRGDAVELAVHNRGPVISEDMRATLFEPFRRGTQQRPGPRGFGLGLFIVRQVVVAHGGTIDVRSSADEGTTFTVRLPRRSRSPSS